MIKLKEEIEKGKKVEFQIRDDDMIVKGQRMCVSEYGELKRDIMEEAHSSAYAMHPGSTKMYKTLKEHYWWNGMKKEIASFVSRYLTCQQVKVEHQKPRGRYSYSLFLYGSGKRLLWILLPSFQELGDNTMPYG